MREIEGDLVTVALEEPVGPEREFLALVVKITIKLIGFFYVCIARRQLKRSGEGVNPIIEEIASLHVGTRQVTLCSFHTVGNKLSVPFLLKRETLILEGKFLYALFNFELIGFSDCRFGKSIQIATARRRPAGARSRVGKARDGK